MASPSYEQIPEEPSHDLQAAIDFQERAEEQSQSAVNGAVPNHEGDAEDVRPQSLASVSKASGQHGRTSSSAPLLPGTNSEEEMHVQTASAKSLNSDDITDEKPIKESVNPSLSIVEDWWLFESLSGLFSVFCLTAIVVVLSLYKDRPLHDWQYPISVNTFVSVFATLAKSSILTPVAACISQLQWDYVAQRPHSLRDLQIFDDASRGPIGAIALILRLRQGAIIASFGALITIVALAFDPFTQQIISFPNRTIAIGETATISKAFIYDDSFQGAQIENRKCW